MDKHFQILEHPRETTIDVTRAILKAFRTHGISIPFPQREVRLLSAP
jgi:small-conductance mechanosensitive channel